MAGLADADGQVEITTNGFVAAKMESEDGKTNDSVATVGSNPELKCLLSGAVKDASAAAAAEAAEAPPTTVTPDSPAAKSEPAVKDVEVEVEAEMEAKEVKKVSETETIVTANGNADPTIAEGADEDDALPSEADHVTIPSHWHATPCVHITGLAGVVTEEVSTERLFVLLLIDSSCLVNLVIAPLFCHSRSLVKIYPFADLPFSSYTG